MAPKQTQDGSAGAGQPQDGVTPNENGQQPAPFDWSQLALAVKMPSTRVAALVQADVIATTPDAIRQRIENLLSRNVLVLRKAQQSSSKRQRPDYEFDVQPVPDVKIGEQFKALVTTYAKGRPADKPVPHSSADSPVGKITVRCGDPTWYRINTDGNPVACEETDDGAFLGVRFSARTLEKRDGGSTPNGAS